MMAYIADNFKTLLKNYLLGFDFLNVLSWHLPAFQNLLRLKIAEA